MQSFIYFLYSTKNMCILCHHFTVIDFQSLLLRHFDHIFSLYNLYIKYPHLHFLANKLSINMRHLRNVLVVSERKTLLHFEDKRMENSFIEGGRFTQWKLNTYPHNGCSMHEKRKWYEVQVLRHIKLSKLSKNFHEVRRRSSSFSELDMLTLTHKQ